MPKSSFIPDSSFIRQFAPVYYVYTYSFFVQFLVVGLVQEKQSRLKETLRIMGMRDAAFWLSWSLLYLMIILTVSAVAVIFAAITTFFRPPSNMFIFFIMLSLYGFSIINLAFVLTPFLNNIQVAGPVAVLATTAVSALFVIVSFTTRYDANGTPSSILPLPVQLLLCLLSPTALSIAIERAIYLDVAQIGLTWSSLYLGDFPLVIPIIMLAFDSILYFFLAVWLDNVVPGEYGKHQPLCYCFQPAYWRSQLNYGAADKAPKEDGIFECINDCPHIEPVPKECTNLNKLQIYDIKKTYKVSSRAVEAVRGITLDIYENEITCILGHNGAGKTSLMNMLTGLTPPTAGTALIYGLDIRDTNDMREIRKITGLCPQYDVLVDNMTCREHLVLYASLKGLVESGIKYEVDKILREVDLTDKADCYTKNLSGGQKRKLSVGIAFIGNPKIIFLDEPSAGMDPKSRRHLWSLLKNKKYGRIILLTTHFMDEADILSDRKAIMSKGKLRCCGSSLYLKTKFGIGYNLNLTVHPTKYKGMEVEIIVKQYVPGAMLAHSHGMEVCFSLPLAYSFKFADLFRKLEEKCFEGVQRATLLGIMSYGISMTTLEEVFLRLAEISESEDMEVKVIDLKGLGSSSHRLVQRAENYSPTAAISKRLMPCLSEMLHPYKTSLKSTKLHVFVALVKIRFLISIRDKMATFSRIILPVILILLSSTVLKFANIEYNPPVSSIELNAQNTFQRFEGQFAYVNDTGGFDTGINETVIANMARLDVKYISSTSELVADHMSYHFGIQLTSESADDLSVILIYNDTWIHSLPMLINLVSNCILRVANKNMTISTTSKPWGSISPRYVFHGSVFTFAVMVGFALIFLPSSFAQTAVIDRTMKAKSQLRVAGLQNDMYWWTVCAVDWAQYMLVALAFILSFFVFQLRALTEPGALLATILFMLLYIPVYMLFLYIFSYGYDAAASSQGLLQTSCILLNILFFVPVGMTAMSDNDSHRRMADTAHIVFTFINPFYSASGFFMHLLKFDVKQSYSQQSDKPIIRLGSYFLWENRLLPTFLAAILWLPILIFTLRLVDAVKSGKSFRSQVSAYTDGTKVKVNKYIITDEDEDVAAERIKTEHPSPSSSSEEPVLIVQNLHKSFQRPMRKSVEGNHIAVKNLTFRVMPGEVLGLLGPNGAGKSTTMNMLTAEITPDAGMVRTGCTNIHTNLLDAYKQMGYCPQFDAVWANITVREHLAAYSVVRGYHPATVDTVIFYFLKLLHLEEHADKQTCMLSGGTKRKLSFAMAMLGNPRVVLLDEPSTGMDPQSKRVFWDAINHSFVGSGRGAILTTHYMEEADALCHRIGIMINGQLECLGTTQHLKTRFGHGYQLEVKLASMKESVLLTEIDKLHDIIFYHFPLSIILEQFGPRVAYKISASDVTSLARSFEILELAKEEVDIGEYSFSQATLEQVFLEFAKYQTEENNNIKEQMERSQGVARSRKVSALHSKVNSSMMLAEPADEELKEIERKLNVAVAKYVNDIQTGVIADNLQKQSATDDVKILRKPSTSDGYYGSSSIFINGRQSFEEPQSSNMQNDSYLKPALRPSVYSYRSGKPLRVRSKTKIRKNGILSVVKFEEPPNTDAHVATEIISASQRQMVTIPIMYNYKHLPAAASEDVLRPAPTESKKIGIPSSVVKFEEPLNADAHVSTGRASASQRQMVTTPIIYNYKHSPAAASEDVLRPALTESMLLPRIEVHDYFSEDKQLVPEQVISSTTMFHDTTSRIYPPVLEETTPTE